jgi:glycosyltransferase involved in cell wall biosynthesis
LGIKILDFLVHGGHQYEFFKNNATFYCMGIRGELHTHNSLGRPKQNNVNFITKKDLKNISPDIIMIRAGVRYDDYIHFIKNGTKPIAVVQTHTPFNIPSWCKIVVWNSKVSMESFKKDLSDKKHYHIVHGFDPNEFKPLKIEKNKRILSSFSLFKQRNDLLGYSSWNLVNNQTNLCDVIGHGNEEIVSNIGTFPYPKLVEIYNSYSGYLNTTLHSAMPRSRAEAMMCGLPIITTSNYDTPFYFKDKVNSLIVNDSISMIRAVNKLISSSKMQEELSIAGRETAIKYFNIETYINKWKNILI